jgi:membrane-bound lytic murein transglycosylase D
MKSFTFKLFLLFTVLLSSPINAKDVFKWTDRHPIITNYVTQNKDRIIEFTPYKIQRSKKYLKFIETVFERHGLPKELAVLAAIESGFREDAVSSANAIGMWQFTKETANDWDLIVTDKRDDRKNWKKSTIAAARYIKWMAHTHFDGNYESAILAYNAGIGRVKRAMTAFNTNDPWELIAYNYLPEESREFLPKFITYMHYFYHVKDRP